MISKFHALTPHTRRRKQDDERAVVPAVKMPKMVLVIGRRND
jgi:hypothetical protein